MFTILNRIYFTTVKLRTCSCIVNYSLKRTTGFSIENVNDNIPISKQKSALCFVPWKCNKFPNSELITSRMYSSDDLRGNERSGPLPIDCILDRQTENYFKHFGNESSNENMLSDDMTTDEDDLFTFDSVFAPAG